VHTCSMYLVAVLAVCLAGSLGGSTTVQAASTAVAAGEPRRGVVTAPHQRSVQAALSMPCPCCRQLVFVEQQRLQPV
jgi:hypothetical protein